MSALSASSPAWRPAWLPSWFPARLPASLTTVAPVVACGVEAVLVNGVLPGPELGSALIAAAALLLRRRLPVTVLLATLPGLYIGYAAFAPLIALYTVACRRADRRLLVLCAALVAVAHLVPYPLAVDLVPSPSRELALRVIDAFVSAGAPVVFGLFVTTRRELAGRLAELTRSRGREDRLLAERVLATERVRLAREMHDVVAHQVSLISLQAGALKVGARDPVSRDAAVTIRELSVRTLVELRQLVGVLRAAGGNSEQLSPQPRLSDIPRLIESGGVAVDCDIAEGLEDRFPEAVERAVFRTVQETLTNVRKHAPGARTAIAVRAEAGGLCVEVRSGPPDPTVPPLDLPHGGHGLIGLRERVQLLGGAFEAGPTRDGGFLVSACLPPTAGR
ncbi:histidine kinase [Streptomyces sp. NPDC051742]|uniref:sensor histidine kinase n=1 Tax=unclassified Streptomyces TaxID=2593676 RepID=UPI00342FB184